MPGSPLSRPSADLVFSVARFINHRKGRTCSLRTLLLQWQFSIDGMYNSAMFRQRKFRSPITWALLFAVLFNIAAPSLAMSRAPMQIGGLAEICTTSGLKVIVTSGVDRAPGDHADLLHDGHCQLCSFNAAEGPIPVVASILPFAIGSIAVPPPGRTLIATPHPGCPPPPSQAPPIFS